MAPIEPTDLTPKSDAGCPHREDGWCSACVRVHLQQENLRRINADWRTRFDAERITELQTTYSLQRKRLQELESDLGFRDGVPPKIVVGVLLVEPGGPMRAARVWLAQRSNVSTMPSYWESGGGKVEFGESIRAAAVREMREEAGVDVNPDHLIPAGLTRARGDHNVAVFGFLYEIDPEMKLHNREPEKRSRWQRFTVAAALSIELMTPSTREMLAVAQMNYDLCTARL